MGLNSPSCHVAPHEVCSVSMALLAREHVSAVLVQVIEIYSIMRRDKRLRYYL